MKHRPTEVQEYREALCCIPPDLPHEDWLKIGMALKDGMNGEGFELFDEWSQGAPNYSVQDATSAWKSIKTGAIKAATLFHYAGQYGYKNTQQPQQTSAPSPIRRDWEAATPVEDDPYLKSKQIKSHGLRALNGTLLIPMMKDGALSSFQRITKTDKGFDKKFAAGGTASGASFTIGNTSNAGRIYIGEGYATCATVHEITEAPVVVAFTCGNLKQVAKQVRAKRPHVEIVILVDDDIETKGNPGLSKANEAAHAVNGLVAIPDFGDERPQRVSDFNDLFFINGHRAVTKSLEDAKKPLPEYLNNEPDTESATGLNYVFASDLSLEDEHYDDELVERVLGVIGTSVFYGDSNSGKTFAAIDLACAVAQGKPWLGQRTVRGVVVYLATEAPASVINRLKAYRKQHKVAELDVAVIKNPIDLFASGADAGLVVEAVKEIEAKTGKKVLLVIGDTLARMSGGANENAGQDMGIVIKHAEQIKTGFHGHFLFIHHTGKDAARGMRGWSGMRAAIDTEIEVSEDAETKDRCIEITKQRDIEGKGDRYGFRLSPISIGTNRWGEAKSSCTVVHCKAPPKKPKNAKDTKPLGLIKQAIDLAGCNEREKVRDEFYALHKGKPASQRQDFNRGWNQYMKIMCDADKEIANETP